VTPEAQAVLDAAVASYHANRAWWDSTRDAAQARMADFKTHLEAERVLAQSSDAAHRCALEEIKAVEAYLGSLNAAAEETP
jgi:hypothetical protein